MIVKVIINSAIKTIDIRIIKIMSIRSYYTYYTIIFYNPEK